MEVLVSRGQLASASLVHGAAHACLGAEDDAGHPGVEARRAVEPVDQVEPLGDEGTVPQARRTDTG